MTVWILRLMRYDRADFILGVFADKQRARDEMEQYTQYDDPYDYTIDEEVVQNA